MVSFRPCVALHAKAGSVVALVFSKDDGGSSAGQNLEKSR